jgi:hypothetical protein
LRAFDHAEQRRTTRDEGDEVGVKGLSLVFGVVQSSGRRVNRSKFARDESKLFRFETGDDRPDQTTFDSVWFHDDERSVHEKAI